MNEKQGAKPSLSFRAQLVLFGLLLVLITAIPPLVIEVQRPWDELNNLIDKGNIIVSQTNTSFTKPDLDKLNSFAFAINELAEKPEEDALIWTFTLIISDKKLPDKKNMQTELIKNELSPEFDYAEVELAYQFWQEQFANNQEVLELFKRYKNLLIQQRQSAQKANFYYDDNYVMGDNGKTLVFVLDSVNWYESSYPGLEFDVIENDCPYFRNYLTKGAGFDSNPTHYYLKIFPKFDTDKWGNWFSVSLAEKNNNIWNNFVVDFDASHVRKLMWTIAGFIFTSLLAVAVILTLLTTKLSRYISQPINDLMTGAKAVIEANYTHVVPISGSREFHTFIQVFNQMLIKLQCLKRLKDALSQTLSPELADRVEKQGLPPDGQDLQATIEAGDVAGFTWFTQKLGKLTIRKLLNEYFDIIHAIVVNNNGLNDKMIGDAFLASFGTLIPKETDDAVNAVKTAIEIQLAIRKVNEDKKLQGEPFLEWRIGVYSGEDFAGFMGSNIKIDFTTIGETTNLASRLESACEIGHVLISAETYQLVKNYFFEGVDLEPYAKAFTVKGLTNQVKAHNIFVSNLRISKNFQATDPKDFYMYEEMDRKLKKFDSLSPEQKQKFSEVVKITLS